MAAPNEKIAVVLPKAGRCWWRCRRRRVWLRLPTLAERRPPNAGWAGVGRWSVAGVGAAEFPKVKELPKLGTRAGLAAPAAALVAPKVDWGLRPG